MANFSGRLRGEKNLNHSDDNGHDSLLVSIWSKHKHRIIFRFLYILKASQQNVNKEATTHNLKLDYCHETHEETSSTDSLQSWNPWDQSRLQNAKLTIHNPH